MSYKIKEVDGEDNNDFLTELHQACFGDSATQADYDVGYWWLVYHGREPIAFAGLTASTSGDGVGYLKRSGVLIEHQGHGLQKRLIRAREAKAKRLGWYRLVTDCTDNPASANSLYRAGFKMFEPCYGWAFPNSLYWQKMI